MPRLTIIIGEDTSQTDVEAHCVLGDMIARATRMVQTAEKIDFDTNAEFINHFIDRLTLMP